MSFLINLLVSWIAVFIAAYITPGVAISWLLTAIIVAVVLGLINATLWSVLRFLTFPVNFLTLGIVGAIIGFLMILLTAQIVPGFEIANWMSGLIFALLLGLISGILGVSKK